MAGINPRWEREFVARSGLRPEAVTKVLDVVEGLVARDGRAELHEVIRATQLERSVVQRCFESLDDLGSPWEEAMAKTDEAWLMLLVPRRESRI